MKLIFLEELTDQGISLSEIHRSLTLNCFGKTFCRKSDLPKKFKEKALNLCQEIIEQGKESFIIETRYSYAIWIEKKTDKKNIKSEYSTVINERSKESHYDTNQDFVKSSSEKKAKEFEEKASYIRKKDIINETIFIEEKYNFLQSSQEKINPEKIQENKNNEQLIPESLEILENVKKYRGSVISQPVNIQTVVEEKTPFQDKVKRRTYRGVAY